MNRLDVSQELETRTEIDLMDFANPNLNDAGELHIERDLSRDVIIKLGRDALQLSKLNGRPGRDVLAISHLTPYNNRDAKLMLIRNGNKTSPEPDNPIYPRELMIGRDDVETLNFSFSPAVSLRHLRLRIYHEPRMLSLRDEYSTNGTRVYLHDDDLPKIITPENRTEDRRKWIREPSQIS